MAEQCEKGELAHEIVLQLIQTNTPITSFNSSHEIKDFIEKLFCYADHSFCPFGRPIMQTISIQDLTSNF